MKWHGVIPAITTAFRNDLSVDHEFVARHVQWLVREGCTGVVALGSKMIDPPVVNRALKLVDRAKAMGLL